MAKKKKKKILIDAPCYNCDGSGWRKFMTDCDKCNKGKVNGQTCTYCRGSGRVEDSEVDSICEGTGIVKKEIEVDDD